MKTQGKSSKAARGGDTSRTSNQGRKLSSGGNLNKRGDKEMDEESHSPKTEKVGTKNKK